MIPYECTTAAYAAPQSSGIIVAQDTTPPGPAESVNVDYRSTVFDIKYRLRLPRYKPYAPQR